VPRPGIAIGAAVFAAPIWVDAVAEGNVGAVIMRNDAACGVGEKFGGKTTRVGQDGIVRLQVLPIRLPMHRLEAIWRLGLRAATDRALRRDAVHRRFLQIIRVREAAQLCT
jgi:hypothetical protein